MATELWVVSTVYLRETSFSHESRALRGPISFWAFPPVTLALEGFQKIGQLEVSDSSCTAGHWAKGTGILTKLLPEQAKGAGMCHFSLSF